MTPVVDQDLSVLLGVVLSATITMTAELAQD
jgi:hypothetical protein